MKLRLVIENIDIQFCKFCHVIYAKSVFSNIRVDVRITSNDHHKQLETLIALFHIIMIPTINSLPHSPDF